MRKGTKSSLTKSFAYEHDFQARDHTRLAEAASRFRQARVVVSYYDHADLAALYPSDRWDYRRLEVTKAIRNSTSRNAGATKALEVLIVNRTAAPPG